MESASESAADNTSATTLRMLYVEDDAIGAGIVKRSLERHHGIRVDLAENGQVGLRLATAGKYDILLVDNDMPEMGGLELVRELRSRGVNVPAIMITGAGDEETAISALKSGCKDYIIKDVAGSFLHLLPAVVDQVLKQETAERMLEEKNRENQRLLSELLESNKKLNKLNELKNEVLSIAAHDLRSPISSVVTAVSYLQSLEEDRESHRYELLNICRGSIDQALGMIEALLDWERLDSGDLDFRLEPTDLAMVLQEVIENHRAHASKKDISVEFDAEPAMHAKVDHFRFRELADNLLSNAIKYSPLGSQVSVRIYRQDGQTCLAVKDSGPGFTESDRQNLYKRFRRLTARPTGNETSTGLGLSIVKKIADLHNAQIHLDTEPGQGSEFIVGIPDS